MGHAPSRLSEGGGGPHANEQGRVAGRVGRRWAWPSVGGMQIQRVGGRYADEVGVASRAGGRAGDPGASERSAGGRRELEALGPFFDWSGPAGRDASPAPPPRRAPRSGPSETRQPAAAPRAWATTPGGPRSPKQVRKSGARGSRPSPTSGPARPGEGERSRNAPRPRRERPARVRPVASSERVPAGRLEGAGRRLPRARRPRACGPRRVPAAARRAFASRVPPSSLPLRFAPGSTLSGVPCGWQAGLWLTPHPVSRPPQTSPSSGSDLSARSAGLSSGRIVPRLSDAQDMMMMMMMVPGWHRETATHQKEICMLSRQAQGVAFKPAPPNGTSPSPPNGIC